ncbi:hypothetical protein BC834DRAFT_630569 [Gloeopeniophorella convolvens]|nr:hypothetical protein BC834DRAFT_630569 [Gloeopeniophorella convolvens]
MSQLSVERKQRSPKTSRKSGSSSSYPRRTKHVHDAEYNGRAFHLRTRPCWAGAPVSTTVNAAHQSVQTRSQWRLATMTREAELGSGHTPTFKSAAGRNQSAGGLHNSPLTPLSNQHNYHRGRTELRFWLCCISILQQFAERIKLWLYSSTPHNAQIGPNRPVVATVCVFRDTHHGFLLLHLSRWSSELPKKKKAFERRQLLKHTSGLRRASRLTVS